MGFVQARAGQVVFRAEPQGAGDRALAAVALAARGIAALHAKMAEYRASHARLTDRVAVLERQIAALTERHLTSPSPTILQDNTPVARPGGVFSRIAAGLAFGLLLAVLVGF